MPKRIQEFESEGSDGSSDESLDLNDSDGDSDSGGGSIDSEPPVNKKARTEPAKAPANAPAATKKEVKSPAGKLNSPPKSSGKSTASALPSKAPATSVSTSSVHQLSSTTQAPTNSGDITRGPPITTDIAAKKLIGQYLTQQNRPYSAIQVHDNLHKRVPKATVERVLTSMSLPDSGFICKEYGKAKIYFVDQNTLPSNFTPQQLDQICAENDALKTENEIRSAEERKVRGELQQLLNEPRDAELGEMIRLSREKVEEKRARVARLASGNPATSTSSTSTSKCAYRTLADATSAHNQFRRAWHSRKMLCMDAVDVLSEGMNKKVKDVMSEMCLESDQDAGVTLPALLPEL